MKGSAAVGQRPVLSAIRAVVIGSVSGAALCAVLLALSALAFVSSENIPQAFLSPFIIVISVLCSFFAGFITARLSRQRGLILGTFAGLLLFIMFLVAGLVSSQNNISAEGGARLIEMVLAGGIGGLVAVSGKSHRK